MTRSLRVRATVVAALCVAASSGTGGVPDARARNPAPPTCPTCVGAGTAAWDSAITRFAGRLAADVRADGIGSITAGVAVGETVVWVRGFGWADPDRRIPAGPATLYRTGSISKSVTAIALARLVAGGTLSLDEPVAPHLPALADLPGRPEGGGPITFRQLASHTAGLVREPEIEGAAEGPIGRWEEKVLASIPHTGFRSRPGTEFSYSNIGFGILGLALSRAAGTPFPVLVDALVFDPLGMSASTFAVPPEELSGLARGYANFGEGPPDPELPAREHLGRGYKVPNGGAYSTASDLLRFAAGVTAGERGLLPPGIRSEALSFQTPPDSAGDAEEGTRTGYGLGFFLREKPSGRWVAYHGGSVAGYSAHLAFDPETRIAVVLLRSYNRGRTDLGRTARGLLEALDAAGRASVPRGKPSP